MLANMNLVIGLVTNRLNMTELQAHLEKRLAGLKKHSAKARAGRSATTGQYSTKNIKLALKESGLLTNAGKVKTLTSA